MPAGLLKAALTALTLRAAYAPVGYECPFFIQSWCCSRKLALGQCGHCRRQPYWAFRKATQAVSMDPRVALMERLEQHSELAYREAPGFLRIEAPSPNGFAVELRSDDLEWTVFLGNPGFT
jgi:hypothetical protein